MSIERIERKRKGRGYKVWFRDQDGRLHARVFDRRRDAEAFEADIKLKKRRGDLPDVEAGKQKLADFAEEWFTGYASKHLERSTLQNYALLWDRHILPRLGYLELRQLKPETIEVFAAELRNANVGAETIRKTLVVLQGALKRAVVWGRITANPVTPITKPSRGRQRTVRPLEPEAIEAIRGRMLAAGRLADATLISVLAYAGLRPGEALALTWADIGDNTILINKRVSLGEIKEGAKSRQRARRTVRLLRPLANDLAEWHLASGRPTGNKLVFPMTNGKPWTDTTYRNWRKRVFDTNAKATGLDSTRPYDLRHSYCSLLLAEGKNAIEVAAQLGHSPTMTLDTYGHVIDELQGNERVSAEELIRAARTQRVNQSSTKAADDESRIGKALQIEEPTRGLEPRTPSLRVMCSTS